MTAPSIARECSGCRGPPHSIKCDKVSDALYIVSKSVFYTRSPCVSRLRSTAPSIARACMGSGPIPRARLEPRGTTPSFALRSPVRDAVLNLIHYFNLSAFVHVQGPVKVSVRGFGIPRARDPGTGTSDIF